MLRAKVRVPRVKALPRERLHTRLEEVWDHRLGLVIAPAGSGKTTVLAQFASGCGAPVAWYRAEPADSGADAAVAHLERALVSALGVTGDWSSVDDAIEALDAWDGDRALIAVDDLHALWGTEAEATLERLVSHLPPGVVMVAATRRAPSFNLSRLRVSGDLVEVGPDDLRFRSWEVERLFQDFYGDRLRPDELAELARRTEGWAAGLQLFHLATRGKPVAERRRMLKELGVRSRLVREYLARNVLDDLPAHVRDFLLQTCVLGRLTPTLCDELTGSTSGEALLHELEQRQIFTAPLDDEGGFRYHEVLRSHLEAALLESVGEAEARNRYQRAGKLLETHGHLPEALRAYCRAEDWESAKGLLGVRGAQVIDRPGEWIEALPPGILEHDPWLLLGWARRYVALGRWTDALDAYRRAESASPPGQPADTSRRERLALQSWFEPAVRAPGDWSSILRLAVVRDPTEVVKRESPHLTGAPGALVTALASLLNGNVREAAARLDAVAVRADASAAVSIAASVAAAIARSLAGVPTAIELTGLCEAADEADLPSLAALARAARALDTGGLDEATSPAVEGDDWGLPLVQLLAGLGRMRTGQPVGSLLSDSAEGFSVAGAPVLETWAAAASALASALAGDAGADADARRAMSLAAGNSVRGALALASAAVAVVDRGDARPAATAARLADDLGLALRLFRGPGGVEQDADGDGATPVSTQHDTAVRLSLRCFGALAVQLDGNTVDLALIKPRVRSLLRVLAMHAGRPVHRDKLVDWLWPGESDGRVGTRNLQVAVSSLRQLLEPGVARGAAAIVVRDGDNYALRLDDGAVDITVFEAEIAAGRRARAEGDTHAAIEAFGRALDLYRGELLEDEGPSEWLLAERDRLRTAAATATLERAELLVAGGQLTAAAAEADRGLRIDQYHDALWRLSVTAYEQAGDKAAARRQQERYDAVLRDLGV